MSELLDAADKQEWEEFMVLHLLVVVLYLQRISASRMALKACYRSGIGIDPSAKAQASPNSVPIPARGFPWSDN
jgi:hypothetical protein